MDNKDFFNLNNKGEESEDDNFEMALKKKQFEGNKGQMLLELQKTYKGDKRFKLDNKFVNDMDVKKVSYGVKELTDVFDYKNEDIKKQVNHNKIKKKEIITIEDELKREKQRNISILSQIISNEEFLSIKPKTTNHQSLITKRFDPLLNIGKEITNKVETNIVPTEEINKVKLKKGVDFEKTVRNNYYENIEEFNLEKKLEINVNAWKDLTAENKQKKINHVPTNFLLFESNEPSQNNHSIFTETKDEKKEPLDKTEAEIKTNTILPVKTKVKKELTLLEKKELEMKKKKKVESVKLRKKKRREEKELKEKNIEEKLTKDFSEAFGEEKTKEYLRIVKMIKEKKFQNLGKKREKNTQTN